MQSQTLYDINHLIKMVQLATPDSLNIAKAIIKNNREIDIPELPRLRQAANERIEKIVAKKKEELTQQIAEASRKHEYEADEVGYIYATRAGFEPDGCLRAMTVLNQLPGTTKDSSHPAVSKRIEAIKRLMSKYPPQALAAEGKAKIAATKPLSYDRSEDGVSLRVNSRMGGSTQDDIDHLFGQ